jgi:hypothetical protein
LNKRFKVSAAIYNLSQLMRRLFGIGTPKQLAAQAKAFWGFIWVLPESWGLEGRSLLGFRA